MDRKASHASGELQGSGFGVFLRMIAASGLGFRVQGSAFLLSVISRLTVHN